MCYVTFGLKLKSFITANKNKRIMLFGVLEMQFYRGIYRTHHIEISNNFGRPRRPRAPPTGIVLN